MIAGFSKRYGCKTLVWYEAHDDIQDARARELQMKKWKRGWEAAGDRSVEPRLARSVRRDCAMTGFLLSQEHIEGEIWQTLTST
jgi:hypothetical protein